MPATVRDTSLDAHNTEAKKSGGASAPEGMPSTPKRKPRRRIGRFFLVFVVSILLVLTAGLFIYQSTGGNLPGLEALPFLSPVPSPTNSPLPPILKDTPWPAARRSPIDLKNVNSLWFGGSLGRGRLIQVAFSSDGGRFFAMTMTGIYQYDTRNLEDSSFQFVQTRVKRDQWFSKANVLSYAVSPVGDQIAVGYEDEIVKVWNPKVENSDPFGIAPDEEDKILSAEPYYPYSTSLAYSPDGSLLAVGGNDNVARIYHVSSGRLLGELTNDLGTWRSYGKSISSVSFSPDGSLLASASTTGMVSVWRVRDGSLAGVFQGHTSAVNGISFSPDGSILASGSWDGTVRLWRVADGSESKVLTLESGVASVAFSPDGNTLTAGLYDGTVRFWRMPDGAPTRTIAGHTDAVISVAFSPDGKMLATGSLDSTVQFWSAADGSGMAALGGFLTDVQTLVFSPDDSILAAGLGNGDINLLRPTVGTGPENRFGRPGADIYSRTMEGDLLESRATEFFYPVDVSTAGILHGHEGRINSIAFSPDGEFLASASSDCSVRVWRVTDGLPVTVFRPHQRMVMEIAYSPDGTLLATAGEDGFIHLWNTKDWSLAASLTADGESFTDVAISPDGRFLAAGSRSLESVNAWGNIVLWNLPEKTVIGKTRATEVWDIFDLAFSPDGSKLAVSSFTSIAMYSVVDVSRLWVVEGEDVFAQPVGVDFLPNGEIVFCADEMSGNMCLFNAETGERISLLYTKHGETSKVVSHKGDLIATGTPYGFIDLFYIY